MSVMQEFKKFALRGNVIDMAVGIIIGAAFGTVVKSLVDDIIMPPIGYVTSGVDFKQKSYTIKNATREDVNGVPTVTKPAITLNYGAFLNNVITFLIVAWAVFYARQGNECCGNEIAVRRTAGGRRSAAAGRCAALREIRDELKRR